MKTTSRIVAFAAVFTLAGIVLPAGPAAADDRRGDAGTPQQGAAVNQPGPVDAQAKNEANYHADYHAKTSQPTAAPDAAGVKNDEKNDDWKDSLQRDRERRNPPNTDRFGRPTFPR